MKTDRIISRTELDRIIQQIIDVAAPGKIILFGSAASGEPGPNSDVDLER